jgi:hypothetical protein
MAYFLITQTYNIHKDQATKIIAKFVIQDI